MLPFAQRIALEDIEWTVTRVPGITIKVKEHRPRLVLDSKEARAYGFTGCNEFSARYRQADRSLTFQRITHTRKGCLGTAAARTETALLNALSEVRSWRIEGSTLLLRNRSGRTLLTLLAGRSDSR